jgi:hypothetical protein
MNQRHIGFLLLLGLLVVERTTVVVAQDQKFTCQAYGDAFVLDDADFKVLAASTYSFRDVPRGKGITREQFASLTPNSSDRLAICNTRALWRAIKAGKLNRCDLWAHYPGWDAELFSEPEAEKVLETQVKLGC